MSTLCQQHRDVYVFLQGQTLNENEDMAKARYDCREGFYCGYEGENRQRHLEESVLNTQQNIPSHGGG